MMSENELSKTGPGGVVIHTYPGVFLYEIGRISAIDYYESGAIKRVEYYPPQLELDAGHESSRLFVPTAEDV